MRPWINVIHDTGLWLIGSRYRLNGTARGDVSYEEFAVTTRLAAIVAFVLGAWIF